jgi:hypothetical protein
MAVRFVPNLRALPILARTPAMGRAMLARAEEVRDVAEEIAPYGEGEGGHYRDQLTADPMVSPLGAGARVNARKFTSIFIEFGTSDTPAFATLRNAATAVGLSLGGKAGFRE